MVGETEKCIKENVYDSVNNVTSGGALRLTGGPVKPMPALTWALCVPIRKNSEYFAHNR